MKQIFPAGAGGKQKQYKSILDRHEMERNITNHLANMHSQSTILSTYGVNVCEPEYSLSLC